MTTANYNSPHTKDENNLESKLSKYILNNSDEEKIILDLTLVNPEEDLDNIIKYCCNIIDYNISNSSSEKFLSVIYDSKKNLAVTDTYEALLFGLHMYVTKNHYASLSTNFLEPIDLNSEFKLVS